MDLITQLPTSTNQNDAIIVFVDKLSKMVHYAPCKTTIDAPGVAQIFFKEIVRHHGVPQAIVSDRDPRFMSNFWQSLWKELGSKLKMSTAYHPQTDGQTERSNRTLEDMLRAYVNYTQDNWDEKLLALEVAVNNSTQESTGFTPFFLNSGQHPHLPLSMITDTTDNEMAQTMLRNLRNNLVVAKQYLLAAQEKQARDANTSRREHSFAVGDQVMLSTENMNVGERARKLVAKYAGPHTIIEHPTTNTYKLDLPPELSKLHPVFHSSLLKAFHDDNSRFVNRPRINRPPAIIDEGEKKYEVEDIKDFRIKKGIRQYLIKWLGYPDSESLWTPTTEVDAPDLVRRFLHRNPSVRQQLTQTQKVLPTTAGTEPKGTRNTMPKTTTTTTSSHNRPTQGTQPTARSQRATRRDATRSRE